MTERREDSTWAAEPRLSVVATPFVQEKQEKGRGQEKRAQGLEPRVAREEAGERGQRTGTEGWWRSVARAGDMLSPGICTGVRR